MGILINDPSVSSIKKLWITLHLVAILSAGVGTVAWFCTPFFTREVKTNRYHQAFRWASVIVGISGGGTSLLASLWLAELEPRKTAIDKYDAAQFKHAVASELYLAQQTNSSIVQSLVTERKTSLSLDFPEYLPEESYGVSYVPDNGNSVSYGTNNETNGVTDSERDQVAIALQDGIPDSEIIRSVLHCPGRKYQEGKAKLERIKSELEKSEEYDDEVDANRHGRIAAN